MISERMGWQLGDVQGAMAGCGDGLSRTHMHEEVNRRTGKVAVPNESYASPH